MLYRKNRLCMYDPRRNLIRWRRQDLLNVWWVQELVSTRIECCIDFFIVQAFILSPSIFSQAVLKPVMWGANALISNIFVLPSLNSYCMDNEIHCLGLPCEEGLLPPDLPTTIDYWSRPITSGQRYNPFLRPSVAECNYVVGKSIGETNIFENSFSALENEILKMNTFSKY